MNTHTNLLQSLDLNDGPLYQAAAARIRELERRVDVLTAELAGYKQAHEQHCSSAARIRELEAALRDILYADPDCSYCTENMRIVRELLLAPKKPT